MAVVALVLMLLVGVAVIAAIIVGIVLLVRAASKPSAPQPYPQQGPAITAPSGWYPDPGDPNVVRYFDGREWAASTQPRT